MPRFGGFLLHLCVRVADLHQDDFATVVEKSLSLVVTCVCACTTFDELNFQSYGQQHMVLLRCSLHGAVSDPNSVAARRNASALLRLGIRQEN
jgi:hypothetical protein